MIGNLPSVNSLYLASMIITLSIDNFNWHNQIASELKDTLYSTFVSVEAAFRHFFRRVDPTRKAPLDDKSVFGIGEFKKGLVSLIPKRFSQHDINFLWGKLAQKGSEVSFANFQEFLEASKFNKNGVEEIRYSSFRDINILM